MQVPLPRTAFQNTFITSPHLQPLEDIWKRFYLLTLLTLPRTTNNCYICWSLDSKPTTITRLTDTYLETDRDSG